MNRAERKEIEDAAAALKRGGIVVYPTETVYGIGCDPLDFDACDRIRRLKGRPDGKSLLLIAESVEQIEEFAGALDERSLKLAEAFWPGPLTLVMKTAAELPAHLRGESGGIAFRVTPHPTAAALCRAFGRPITSTSANPAGGMPVLTAGDAVETFGGLVDAIIGSETPLTGVPSTVLDITAVKPYVLREGSVGEDAIREVLNR